MTEIIYPDESYAIIGECFDFYRKKINILGLFRMFRGPQKHYVEDKNSLRATYK